MRGTGLDVATDGVWAEAHRRELVIRLLAAARRLNSAAAAEAIGQLGIGRFRLFDLIRAYKASPHAATSCPVARR